jgi:hypothetical protein
MLGLCCRKNCKPFTSVACLSMSTVISNWGALLRRISKRSKCCEASGMSNSIVSAVGIALGFPYSKPLITVRHS